MQPLYTDFSFLVSYHFQPWAIPSLFAALFNLGLAAFIWKRSSRDIASKVYILALLAFIIWGVAEFMQRSSLTREGAMFWGDMWMLGPALAGVLFFTFTLIFIERAILLENIAVLLLLYGPSIFFLYLTWNTDLIITNNYEKVFWGWDSQVGSLYFVFLAWVVGLFVASLALLARFYFRIEETRKKKQILLILFGVSVPLVGGTLTDGLFPLFKVALPGLTIVLTAVFVPTVSYAIVQYKLFVISPARALSVIIDSMSEFLIVLNHSHQMELVNRPILETLNYSEEELIGENIKKIIVAGEVWEDYKRHCLDTLAGTGGIIHHESQLLSKKGEKIPVRFSVSVLRSPTGESIGVVMLAFDISQQKKLIHDLEEATRKMQVVRYNLEKQLSRIEKI